MPKTEPFYQSTKLTVIDGGKVNFLYFSPEEVTEYKNTEDFKWPRVDISKQKEQDEPEDSLKDVVKDVAKKVFLDQKDMILEDTGDEGKEPFDSDIFDDYFSKKFEEAPKSLSDIEQLEIKLNEYIEGEKYGRAAQIRDEIRKQKDSDT